MKTEMHTIFEMFEYKPNVIRSIKNNKDVIIQHSKVYESMIIVYRNELVLNLVQKENVF